MSKVEGSMTTEPDRPTTDEADDRPGPWRPWPPDGTERVGGEGWGWGRLDLLEPHPVVSRVEPVWPPSIRVRYCPFQLCVRQSVTLKVGPR